MYLNQKYCKIEYKHFNLFFFFFNAVSQFITLLTSLNALIKSPCLIPETHCGILLIHHAGTHFIDQCGILKYTLFTFEV